jgi:hypothetical protein
VGNGFYFAFFGGSFALQDTEIDAMNSYISQAYFLDLRAYMGVFNFLKFCSSNSNIVLVLNLIILMVFEL